MEFSYGVICRHVLSLWCLEYVRRGQQLKDISQLDGWRRDGSAAFLGDNMENNVMYWKVNSHLSNQ